MKRSIYPADGAHGQDMSCRRCIEYGAFSGGREKLRYGESLPNTGMTLLATIGLFLTKNQQPASYHHKKNKKHQSDDDIPSAEVREKINPCPLRHKYCPTTQSGGATHQQNYTAIVEFSPCRHAIAQLRRQKIPQRTVHDRELNNFVHLLWLHRLSHLTETCRP